MCDLYNITNVTQEHVYCNETMRKAKITNLHKMPNSSPDFRYIFRDFAARKYSRSGSHQQTDSQ